MTPEEALRSGDHGDEVIIRGRVVGYSQAVFTAGGQPAQVKLSILTDHGCEYEIDARDVEKAPDTMASRLDAVRREFAAKGHPRG